MYRVGFLRQCFIRIEEVNFVRNLTICQENSDFSAMTEQLPVSSVPFSEHVPDKYLKNCRECANRMAPGLAGLF